MSIKVGSWISGISVDTGAETPICGLVMELWCGAGMASVLVKGPKRYQEVHVAIASARESTPERWAERVFEVAHPEAAYCLGWELALEKPTGPFQKMRHEVWYWRSRGGAYAWQQEPEKSTVFWAVPPGCCFEAADPTLGGRTLTWYKASQEFAFKVEENRPAGVPSRFDPGTSVQMPSDISPQVLVERQGLRELIAGSLAVRAILEHGQPEQAVALRSFKEDEEGIWNDRFPDAFRSFCEAQRITDTDLIAWIEAIVGAPPPTVQVKVADLQRMEEMVRGGRITQGLINLLDSLLSKS